MVDTSREWPPGDFAFSGELFVASLTGGLEDCLTCTIEEERLRLRSNLSNPTLSRLMRAATMTRISASDRLCPTATRLRPSQQANSLGKHGKTRKVALALNALAESLQVGAIAATGGGKMRRTIYWSGRLWYSRINLPSPVLISTRSMPLVTI